MEWVIWVIAGILLCSLIVIPFIFGVSITEHRFDKQCEDKLIGSLKIDTSDPDGPYIFAEFNKPIETIFKNKYVILKIDSHD